MSTEVIFWTQIVSLAAYVGTAFWLYKILADAKDATIKLLETRVAGLNSEIASLKERSLDHLNERLANRGKLLEDQLRLQQEELTKAESQQQELREQVSELERKLKNSEGDKSTLVDEIVSTSTQLGKVSDRVDSLSDIWIRGLPPSIDGDAFSSSGTVEDSDVMFSMPLYLRDRSAHDNVIDLMEALRARLRKRSPPYGVLRSFVKNKGRAFITDADDNILREEFSRFTSMLDLLAGGPSSYDIEEMKRSGWMDSSGFLTPTGIAQLRLTTTMAF